MVDFPLDVVYKWTTLYNYGHVLYLFTCSKMWLPVIRLYIRRVLEIKLLLLLIFNIIHKYIYIYHFGPCSTCLRCLRGFRLLCMFICLYHLLNYNHCCWCSLHFVYEYTTLESDGDGWVCLRCVMFRFMCTRVYIYLFSNVWQSNSCCWCYCKLCL